MSNKKVIESLTPAQEEKIKDYYEKYLAIGLSTERCNRPEAEKALKESYAYLKLDEPEIVWCSSPSVGAKLAAQTAKGSLNVTDEEVQEQSSMASYGSFEAYWVSFYDFIASELDVEKDSLISIVRRIVQNCGVYWTFEGLVIATEKPVSINFDSQKRLHHETQAAILYADGTGVYALNGIRVPAWVIETSKDKIDPKAVLALTNTEQRMAVMRFVGLSSFLDTLGAQEIDAHKDYRLYYLNVEGQKIGPYLYMKCPSSGRVFLEGVGDADKYENIDPTIKTCQDALNWRAVKASNSLMTKFTMDWKMNA